MADVGISVKLDGVSSALSDLGKLNKGLGQTETATKKASAGASAMGASLGQLRSALAGLGVAYATRETIQLADAMTNMQSRIKLVVGSTEKAVATQQKLMDVANRTRSNFESVGALYSRIGRSADELGLSQERLIGFTETFSQALQISGASTGEAASTILQLSQALASGRLQGAELNAVLEAGGRAAQAIADGLGVPIGTLKKLGEQGELTSQRIIAAIESQAGVINSEFSGMEVTVSGSMQVLQNSIAEVIGKLNAGTGATKGLSEQIIALAEYIKQPDTVNAIVAWGQAFADLGKILYGITDIVSDVNHGLNMMLSDALYTIGAIDKATNEATRKRSLTSMAGEGAMAITGAKAKLDEWKPSGKFGGTAVGGWAEIQTAKTTAPAAFDLSKVLGGGKDTSAGKRAAKDARDQFKDYLDGLRDEYDQLESVQDEMWSQAASLIESARTPLQGYQDEIASVNTLFADGYMTVDQYTQVVDDMNLALANTNQSVLAFETAFDSAFDAAISGGEDFEDTLKSIGKTLATDLFKENIFNPTKDALKTGIGGLLGGGGRKSESPLGALGSEDGQTVTDSFLTRLSGIFGEGDDGFIGSLKTLFAGEEGLIGQLASMFSDAWDWMGNLLTSFLTEMGLMQAWELAERWALAIWEDISRWAVAIFEAAAGLLGFETGGELTVTRPTLFVAGEKNKAERVRVSPLSGGQRGETRGGSGGFAGLAGNGGGGATTNVQVFIPPTSVISGLTEGAFARTITKAVRRQAARTV